MNTQSDSTKKLPTEELFNIGFGAVLEEALRQKWMSQWTFAESIWKSQSYISRILAGQVSIWFYDAIVMLQSLGMEYDWIPWFIHTSINIADSDSLRAVLSSRKQLENAVLDLKTAVSDAASKII